MLKLLIAIFKKRVAFISIKSKKIQIIPVKILYKIQTGEYYIAGILSESKKSQTWKLSNIESVEEGIEEPLFLNYQEQISKALKFSWAGNLSDNFENLDHVEFDIVYSEKLLHIYNRLEKEKKHGTVIKTDEFRAHFSIDVSDANEMVPWLRSFVAYIENLYISNEKVMNLFISDFSELMKIYGIEE